jgi:hypothetical protein
MARSKLRDCLEKTKRLPREVKRSIAKKADTRAEEQGIEPKAAAKAVLTELRDAARADREAVQQALGADIRESLAPLPVDHIVTTHNRDGGSTINAVHGDLGGTNSYSVSIFPEVSTPIPGKTVTKQQIHDHAAKAKAAGLDTSNANLSIGTWYDEEAGVTVLDVVFTTTDRERAIELGKQFNQKAIFDLANFEEISTGGTGEAIGGLPPMEERLGIIFPPGNISPSYARAAQDQATRGAAGATAQAPEAITGGTQGGRQEVRGLYEEGAQPLTPQHQAAEAVAADIQGRMPAGPKVRVVATTEEIAGEYGPAAAARLLRNRPEAFYDPRTDTVVLIAENAAPMEGETLEAYWQRKALHEATGHGGLRRLFQGGQLAGKYLSLLGETVYDFLSGQDFGEAWATKHGYRSLAELAQHYGYDITEPEDRARTVEEHLSRLAEDPAPPKWFDAVLTRITALMRELGFNTWSNADTRTLLLQARDQVGLDRRSELEQQSELRFSEKMGDISGDPEKERKFVTSVKNAAEIMPEVKERVHGVYRVLTNKETVAAATAWIQSLGIEEALRQLRNTLNPTARDYAAGIQLMKQLQAAGRFDDSSELAMAMAEHATHQGQAIQALSLLSALTPEGAQVHAARVIARDIKKNPKMEKMAGEVARLRAELRKARALLAARAVARKGPASRLLERINAQLVKNPKSIWGRYKGGAVKQLASKLLGPKPPRAIPALEAFTKRLTRNLREQLPKGELRGAPPSPAPVDEAAMLGEAVRNFDKYKEVWEEAQRYVQELYKDHPEALQSLDDYFGQILERPFSQQSLERAVRQVIKEMHTSMQEILIQSSGEKAQRKAQLKQEIMTRSGLTGEDAEQVAEAINEEFERELQAERDKTLRRLERAGGTTRLNKSEMQKLIERNNAGQLDDNRFFAHLAKAYDIPAWTPELSEKIKRLQRDYEKALETGNDEIALMRAAEIFDAIHSIVPEDAWAKVAAVQNIVMLMNPKTVVRNVIGNAVLFAVDVPVDAVHAYLVDPVVGWWQGKRVRRSVDVAARWIGLVQPARDWWNGYRFARESGASQAKSIKEGVKTVITLGKLTSGGKFSVGDIKGQRLHTFSSRFGRLMEDGLSLMLSPFDRAFYQSAYLSSIARQQALARAEGRTDIATAEMVQQGMLDAARAIYQDETKLAKGFAKIRRGLNEATPLIGSERWGLGSIIVPFAQVPANIMITGMQYSPIGFIMAAYELGRPMFGQEFRQKEFGEAIARAATGTGALFVTGMWLYGIGVATGMPDEDDDLEAMRQASGMGKYSINISALWRAMLSGNWWTKQTPQAGDLIKTYDWAQPLAMPLAMGVDFARASQEAKSAGEALGKPEPWYAAALPIIPGAQAALGTLADQPLVKGLYQLAVRAAGSKNIFAAAGQAVLDIPSMFVPTLVNQVNQFIGNNIVPELRGGGLLERAVNRTLARIPGLSQRFPPKYDVFGEAIQRYQYGGNSFFNVFLNPATTRVLKSNPAIREMQAVHAATGDSRMLPDRVPTTLVWQGAKVPLTNEQISKYQQLSGTLTMGIFTELAASPEFAAAPAGVKAQIMGQAVGAVAEVSKEQIIMGETGVQDAIVDQLINRAETEMRLMETPAPAGP